MKTQLEIHPLALLFKALGGFEGGSTAHKQSKAAETELVNYMRLHDCTIELATINGKPKLVFAKKPQAN